MTNLISKLIIILFISVNVFAASFPDILTGMHGESILGKGFSVAVALSPDNKTLATGTYLGIFLWDLTQDYSRPCKFIPVEDFLYKKSMALKVFFNYRYCMQFMDNERLIAGVDSLSIFDCKTGTKISNIPLDHIEEYRFPLNCNTPVVSSDSKWIFTCQSDLLFKKRDIETGTVYSQYKNPYVEVRNSFTDNVFSITKDNKYLVILYDDYPISGITISDIETWNNQNPLSSTPMMVNFSSPNSIYSVHCCDNPDNLCIITVNQSVNPITYRYHRYSFSENKLEFECELPDPVQTSLSYHTPNGELFVFDGLVINVSDGTLVRKLENLDTDGPFTSFFAEKNDSLLCGFTRSAFYLWDSLTGKCKLKSSNIDFPFDSIFAYSQITNQLNINHVMVDLSNSDVKQIPFEGVYTIKISADGKKIFRTNQYHYGDDNTVYVCDTVTGNTLQTCKIIGRPGFISPDEKAVWVRQNGNKVKDYIQHRFSRAS